MNDSKNIELSCNKALLIYGNPGTGKTHLALELLKDTILLRIDVSQIKEIRYMKLYILDRLKKRNITLMFEEKRERRGLLIDDIHIFNKHDKSCFKSLIEFIKDGIYYKSNVVITCCNSFINNKSICKLKINRYHLNYTYPEYHKLCLKIVKEKNLQIDSRSINNKIRNSNYSFNNFLSECSGKNDLFTKDNFDGQERITEKMIKGKYSFQEVFRICEGDEKVILLNLIENINNDFIKIYNFCDNFNQGKIFTFEPQFLNTPIKMINSTIQTNSTLIYNRYISKNMIRYKNIKNNSISDRFLYLLDTYSSTSSPIYRSELAKVDDKIIKYHINVYESLYDTISLYQSS
jgi:hypothetical protein|tara:strand:+ start:6434 stop:7477 length:1044 start_codon:yes stop_codon:yes gene_type:complete